MAVPPLGSLSGGHPPDASSVRPWTHRIEPLQAVLGPRSRLTWFAADLQTAPDHSRNQAPLRTFSTSKRAQRRQHVVGLDSATDVNVAVDGLTKPAELVFRLELVVPRDHGAPLMGVV